MSQVTYTLFYVKEDTRQSVFSVFQLTLVSSLISGTMSHHTDIKCWWINSVNIYVCPEILYSVASSSLTIKFL